MSKNPLRKVPARAPATQTDQLTQVMALLLQECRYTKDRFGILEQKYFELAEEIEKLKALQPA